MRYVFTIFMEIKGTEIFTSHSKIIIDILDQFNAMHTDNNCQEYGFQFKCKINTTISTVDKTTPWAIDFFLIVCMGSKHIVGKICLYY